jgi:hypothetical protein
MADSSYTQTGLSELQAQITQFPATVTRRLRIAAERRARVVYADMVRLLNAQTHGEGNTARALEIVEDAANKQFIVRFGLIDDRPANLPLWLEYGTVHMTARPFARPAAEANRAPYAQDQQAACDDAMAEAFG